MGIPDPTQDRRCDATRADRAARPSGVPARGGGAPARPGRA